MDSPKTAQQPHPAPRDTVFQAYIDLWAASDAPYSPPPIPPPKDTFKKTPVRTCSTRPAPVRRTKSVVMRMTEKKLEGHTPSRRLRKRRPSTVAVPAVLEQLQAAFGAGDDIFNGTRRNSEGTVADMSRFSVETNVTLCSPTTDQPLCSATMNWPPSAGAMSFSSIMRANPFSDTDTESVLRKPPTDMDGTESIISRSTPFEPEDMWKYHRPSIFKPINSPRVPPAASARVTAMGGRRTRRPSSSAASIRSVSTVKSKKLPLLPKAKRRPAALNLDPVTVVERPIDTAATMASECYDSDMDSFTTLAPAPPPAPYRAQPQPTPQLKPRPSRTSVSSTSSTSSISSTPSNPAISQKALNLLGIDSLPIPLSPRSVLPENMSEKYEASYLYARHRRTPSSGSSSTNSFNAWSAEPAHVTTHPPYDATLDAACIFKALKKQKKPDSDLLTATIVAVSHEPHKIRLVRNKYQELYSASLLGDIRARTNGNYRLTLSRLVEGPYEAEAQWLDRPESSHFFVDDKLIAEALFGKNPGEIKLIKSHFEKLHGYSLQAALETMYLSQGAGWEHSGAPGWFGRACIRTLKTEREVETVEMRRGLDGRELRARERQVGEVARRLYRPRGSMKVLDKEGLLEVVLTKSDLWLAELNRAFYEMHGVEITELVVTKDRSKMITGAFYPVNLVSCDEPKDEG